MPCHLTNHPTPPDKSRHTTWRITQYHAIPRITPCHLSNPVMRPTVEHATLTPPSESNLRPGNDINMRILDMVIEHCYDLDSAQITLFLFQRQPMLGIMTWQPLICDNNTRRCRYMTPIKRRQYCPITAYYIIQAPWRSPSSVRCSLVWIIINQTYMYILIEFLHRRQNWFLPGIYFMKQDCRQRSGGGACPLVYKSFMYNIASVCSVLHVRCTRLLQYDPAINLPRNALFSGNSCVLIPYPSGMQEKSRSDPGEVPEWFRSDPEAIQ